MPVNRFDRPYGQQYVSTYVPIPLSEIGALAKQYQDKSDLGKQLPQQLDILEQSIQAAPIHYDKKARLMDKYKGAINDIVSQARPEDYAKPEYQNKIQNLIYQFKNDPEVNQIQNTKTWWDKEYVPYINDPDKSNKALIYDIHETSPGVYQQTDKEVSRLKVTPYEDRQKAAEDIVGGIKSSGYLKEAGYDFGKGLQVGPGGEYLAYNKITKGWEGVTKDKLGDVVKHSIGLYGDTKAGKHHIQELLLNEGFGDEAYNYDYNKITQLAKDPKYKNLKEYIDNNLAKHLFDTGFKQVGGKSQYHIDNMTLKDDARAELNKATREAAANVLPTYEGNVDVNSLTDDQALSLIGVKPLDYNGFLNTGDDPKNILANVERLKQTYKGMEWHPDYQFYLEQLRENLKGNRSNQQIANQHYASILNTARNVGLEPSNYKLDNGRTDFDALKRDLTDYAKAYGTQVSSIQGLQTNYADNLTKDYFGEFTEKGFKKSPRFQKLSIYEQGNPASKDKLQSEEVLSELAQNGQFFGLDFNDKNLGAMNFTATKGKEDTEPKIYTAVSDDKVMKAYMQNVHSFSQGMNDAASGKRSKTASNRDKEIIGNTLTSLRDRMVNSNDPYKDIKASNLDNVFNTLVNKDIDVVYGTNAKRDKLFIGQTNYNPNTKQIENNTIVVDIATGEVYPEPISLGKIQNEESAYIQSVLAPSKNVKSPGYIPKDVTYE